MLLVFIAVVVAFKDKVYILLSWNTLKIHGCISINRNDRRGRDRMVVGFITPYAISALCVRIALSRGVLETTLCDKVCQWLAAGWWFSPGTPVSSTIKTDCHDMIEILLKVVLNTITPNIPSINRQWETILRENTPVACLG